MTEHRDYVDWAKVINLITANHVEGAGFKKLLEDMMKLREEDVVDRDAYNQVVWERDVALNQLAEIGKGLGEKMYDIVSLQQEKAGTHRTNQQVLAELSPEECYDCMSWLFGSYGGGFTNTMLAIIDWLKAEPVHAAG